MGLLSRLSGDSISAQEEKQITGKETELQLIQKFESWFDETTNLYEKRVKYSQINRDYYLGKLFPGEKKLTNMRLPWKSTTTHNKIFENVETVVPIMTEDVPEPLGAINSNDPAALDAVRTVESALKYVHRIDDFDTKVEQMVRDMLINRDAVVCPLYDFTKGKYGDVTVEVLDPRYFRVDPNSTYDRQGNYFFKAIPRTYRWAVTHYPDKKKEIKESFGASAASDVAGLSDDDLKDLENTVLIKELWYWREEENGEFHIWCAAYIGNYILYHSRNPYWDFEGKVDKELEKQKGLAIEEYQQNVITNEGREATEEELAEIHAEFDDQKEYMNFMEKEELPYIIIPSFPDYTSPFSVTSLIEQVASLQDALNKRKQQIDENANLTANVQWRVDKESGVDVRMLSSKPGLVVSPKAGTVVQKLDSPSLPGYVFDDKQDTAVALDNVFGANSISKGQKVNTNTATEATILKDADEGRIALLMRHLYSSLEKIYQWQVHLMKLFYTEERQVVLFNSVGGFEAFKTISSDDIPDGMQVFINVGSAQPRDQFTKRREADALFSQRALDPITYYQLRGDIADPEDAAMRLDKWLKGTLFEEKPPSVEELAHQENEMIRSGQARTIEDIPPNQDVTEAHLLIHRELFEDPKSGLTDKQMALLEQLIGLEDEILDSKLNEKINSTAVVEQQNAAAQQAMPVDPMAMMQQQGPQPGMSDAEMAAAIAESEGMNQTQDVVM